MSSKRTRRETNNLQNYTSQRRLRNTIVQQTTPVPPKLNSNDFEVLSLLGRGGFGVVYLVRKSDTKEVLALKRCSKADISARNKTDEIANERNILAKSVQHKNVWLVNLTYSFQDEKYLYLAMDFMPGGDLATVLRNLGCMELSSAQFYMAEMVMAVSTLHKIGYIHRDLKPANFLIDKEGHLKLGDFGLSKAGVTNRIGTIMGKLNPNLMPSQDQGSFRTRRNTFLKNTQISLMATTFSRDHAPAQVSYHEIVGSADYIPPEILRGATYTFLADWWSLGVILYEMIAGIPPFYSENVQETFSNIMNYSNILQFPSDVDESGHELIEMSDEAWSLINSLICEPENRLGLERGKKYITDHDFFKGIAWARTNQPPFVPELMSETDTSYFDPVASKDEKDENGPSEVNILGFSFQMAHPDLLARGGVPTLPSLVSSPTLTTIQQQQQPSSGRKRGECVTGLGNRPQQPNLTDIDPRKMTPEIKASLITNLISVPDSHLLLEIYYNLMRPDEILDELLKRFGGPKSNGKEEDSKMDLPIQMRVLRVLDQWLRHYPNTFKEDMFMCQRLESFLNKQKQVDHPVVGPEIARLTTSLSEKIQNKKAPRIVHN